MRNWLDGLIGKICPTPRKGLQHAALQSHQRTHGSFLQKTRHTRPDCPQQGLDSETIVTVHPQSATYRAVCSVVKGHPERSGAARDASSHARRPAQQSATGGTATAIASRLALRHSGPSDSRSRPAGATKYSNFVAILPAPGYSRGRGESLS